MKQLPLGISTFEKLISDDYIYVDKTNQIYNLITRYNYIFLSRPRRFGKSLLISTLKELFAGNKKLFNNLWIESSNYSWSEHPVIHLDFSAISHRTPEQLRINLSWQLERIADSYGIDVSLAPSVGAKLQMLVIALAEKAPVVLLVDEYDKPLLDHLHNNDVAKEIRTILSSFYDVVKSLDAYWRSIFITGVSRFSKTSIFSGMNNLNDISFDAETANLLGYTEQEIDTYFSDYIEHFAQEQDTNYEKIRDEMRSWYNGYRFSAKNHKVYNPFSVLFCLDKKKFENYWFTTGTPTFLVDLIKKDPTKLESIEKKMVSGTTLNRAFDIGSMALIPILYQTGYLTIKDYDKKYKTYLIGYPNEEVRESTVSYLLSIKVDMEVGEVESSIAQIRRAVDTNDIDLFFLVLKSLLANIPYQIQQPKEAFFHALFQALCTLLGLDVQSEVSTSKGRIDLVIVTEKYIYLFELKLKDSAQQALQQIMDKRYYEKYLTSGKVITLIGMSFSLQEKELIIDWVTKELKP